MQKYKSNHRSHFQDEFAKRKSSANSFEEKKKEIFEKSYFGMQLKSKKEKKPTKD